MEQSLFSICLLGYCASRLCGLTLLPIFLDEGNHILGAHEVLHGHVLAPLVAGKALQIWVNTLVVVPWLANTLWASRFINALCGAITLWGCYKIGTLLFNKWVGLISAGLYIICPFTLFYDRLAMSDGMLSTFGALTLLWSISIFQDPRKKYIWLLGASMVLGLLAKMSGVLLLLTPLLVYLFMFRGKGTKAWGYLGRVYLYVAIFSAIPVFIFVWKTTQISFVTVLSDHSVNVLRNVYQNIGMTAEWLTSYWTPPVTILGIIGLVMGFVKRQSKSILLATLVVLPIILLAGIARIWFPRYILFASVPLLILVSWTIVEVERTIESCVGKMPWHFKPFHVSMALSLVVFAMILLAAIRIDWCFWSDPSRASLPRIERFQYIEEWPSGYGVKEAAEYLLHESTKHTEGIVVIHHEMGDTTYYGLRVYCMKETRIDVERLGLNEPESFVSLLKWASHRPTFVLLSWPDLGARKEDQPDIERLLRIARLEKSYPKPGGSRIIEVYRVN